MSTFLIFASLSHAARAVQHGHFNIWIMSSRWRVKRETYPTSSGPSILSHWWWAAGPLLLFRHWRR